MAVSRLRITLVLILCAAPLLVAAEPLWQVGICDDSYAEFGIEGDHLKYKDAFPGGGVFEVGKGNPRDNWAYVQPGPEDAAWAGEGEHPFEVIFFLDDVPRGPFLLQVDLVDVNPSVRTVLRVRVNELIREFDLKPGASEASLTDPSRGREQVIRMYVGGGHLHNGRNVVNLTVSKGSWVLYDCISLAMTEDLPALGERLSLDPTYLFKERNGVLKQIVCGSLDLMKDQENVRVELRSDLGWTVQQTFENVASGHQDLEIEIDPVEMAQKAHLKVFLGSEVMEADGVISPQKRWKIYLLPSSHFDYGYTAVQDQAMKVHRDNVERAIDWCARYPGFGWDLEGSFIAEDYLKNGSRPDDFLRLARDGRIGVMGFFASELTGNCSSEGLSRTVDFYDYLRHTYGMESRCAMQNDVPTMVGTVPMVLAGHGIKYLSHGTNWVRAGHGQKFNQCPYYWESPDGSRVLMWKVLGIYAECLEVCGLVEGQDSLAETRVRLSRMVDEHARRRDYPYDAFLLHGAYMDNVASDDQLARVPDMWNRVYAYPKVIFCRGREFFEYIEANFAKEIPTLKGDGGVFWEDGAGSSARETAVNRIAEQNLVTAEKIASVCGADFQRKVRRDISDAWRDVTLYNEHTWGAAGSVDAPESEETLAQWAVKKSFADRSSAAAKKLLKQAMDKLCAGIAAGKDSVVVFNPSGWPRSERVTFRDTTGRSRSLLAESVPAMGYRVFPISDCAVETAKPARGGTLENLYYRIKFDRVTGAVSSIYDRQLGRELVARGQYGANQYLYVSGGDTSAWEGPESKTLKVNLTSGAKLQKAVLPGRQIMTMTCVAPMARSFSSQVVLYDNAKRIDFINRVDKTETYKKEGAYFAFPLAFSKPTFRIEIPNGVIRPVVDQFPGACKDWYTVQHFMTVSDGSAAVAWSPIDSPLVTLQDINRTHWYGDLKIANGDFFAYVMNNYWFTNYKAGQGGPLTFRFSMTSAKRISDLEAKRFGESIQSPLICWVIKGKPGAKGASARGFVEVEGSGVVLQAMPPARFWDGTIIRLREMGGKTVKARLKPNGIKFRKAYLCNLAEDKLGGLPVNNGTIEVPCKALGLATVLLER